MVLQKEAYLGLGSNLANPMSQLKLALKALAAHPAITLFACSSFYLTKPVGYAHQPDYINSVAKIHTHLAPLNLLSAVLTIERQLGRKRLFKNAPRIIDIDILYYQQVVWDDKKLVLPHPRLFERAFVLVPLAELAPDLFIAPYGKVRELLNRITCHGVKQLE